MNDVVIDATSRVHEGDLPGAKLGPRFARLDLLSQMAVLAVESLKIDFADLQRDRVGICLAAQAGCLSTDLEYWQGRNLAGGPSPTLFAYTLPSAAIGEIAIRYGIKGPNLCFVGEGKLALDEASELIGRGEADACVCISCQILTPAAAELLETLPCSRAEARFLRRT